MALLCLTWLLLDAGPVNAAPSFDYLPETEVKQLLIENTPSAVLVRSWLGPKQLGAAIILPSPGQGPDTSGLISFLRHRLNTAGWATLAVTPPLRIEMPNFVTGFDEVTTAGEKQLALKPGSATPNFTVQQQQQRQDTQQAFLINTVAQLDQLGHSFPGKRLLIATDESAGMVISLLSQNKLPAPDILVVINPLMSTDSDNQKLAARLAQLSIPVLDIQSSDGLPASKATQEQRLQLSPANAPFRYRQQKIALDLGIESGWQTCFKLIESFAYRIDRAYPNR